MKKHLVGMLLAVIASLACACDDLTVQNSMADALYADSDYHQYICGSNACDKEAFKEQLEFRSETLNDAGNITGCFVEPQRKATNFFTGFFVVKGNAITLQFIFFGSGIGSIAKVHRGYRTVVGSEIVEHGETVRHTFQWNGKVYWETASKSLKWN